MSTAQTAGTPELSSLPLDSWAQRLTPWLIALFWTGLSYALIGDLYLNLRDEGYLWYGVQAVGRGELPFRDFQSYDPGRYYWCWFWNQLFGESILGMRAGLAIFQWIGLSLALVVLQRVFRGWRWLLPAGLLLMLWMFPRFKVFEATLSMLGMWSLVRVIERPSGARLALAGWVLGTAAFFGRNHGLYLGAANLALFGLLWIRARGELQPRRLPIWALGVLLGYAPMLGMLLWVPGFAEAFWRELLATAQRGANLPQDFPWPWSFAPAGLEGSAYWGAWIEQAAFWLPLIALPLGSLLLLRTPGPRLRSRAALLGAALVGLAYVHHYAVRSDLPHLAQAGLPLLVLLLLSAGLSRRRWIASGVLALLLAHGLLLAQQAHPTFKQFRLWGDRIELEPFHVAGVELCLKASQARHLERVRRVVEKYVPPGERMFIAPTRTTFYPLFGKASEVWWIYFLFQGTEKEQKAVIQRLEQREVHWALADEKSFAKDEAFDLRNTNPLIWEHLVRHWMRIQDPLIPPGYFLFQRP